MSTAAPERDPGLAPDPPGGPRRRAALRRTAVRRAAVRWVATLTGLLAFAVLLVLAARTPPRPPGPDDGVVLTGAVAQAVTAAVGLVAVALLVAGLVRRTPWHYPEEDARRDERIDLLRGVAIVFVVLNHVNIPSLFQVVSQEAVGVVSGAELFVAMSGVVLGMVYRPRIERTDLLDATGALWGRAGKLYRTALAVVAAVFLWTLVPGVDGRVVTTFTDQATGQVYGLYPNVERLLDYPVPGYVLRDILLLRLGPFQFNVMGLYVVLLLVTPLVLAALRRRLVLPLLGVSLALYALNLARPTRIFGSQFEDPFPLLSWQVLFVLGLAAGWYRAELLAFARRPLGKAVVAAVVLGHLAIVFFSWNNPNLANAYDVRLALIPADTFNAVYAAWFERRAVEPGRLLDVLLLLVTGYALLTAYWRPLHRALGWFLVPLGQATLYVFILHVFVALAVANTPGLDRGNVLLNTLAHAAVLGLLWGMVKRRFLFRLVPR